MNTVQVPRTGWLDMLKDTLHYDNMRSKFYEYQPLIIELGLSFGFGFLAGFFLKKFGKLIAFIIGALVIIGLLQQLGIITFFINWMKIHELFGIQPHGALDSSLINYYCDWIKEHMFHTMVCALGFLCGLRLA